MNGDSTQGGTPFRGSAFGLTPPFRPTLGAQEVIHCTINS
jgi:hypothetical protein